MLNVHHQTDVPIDTRIHYAIDRGSQPGVMGVTRGAHRSGQIGCADLDDVDAFDRNYVIDLFYGFFLFDHDTEDYASIGPIHELADA